MDKIKKFPLVVKIPQRRSFGRIGVVCQRTGKLSGKTRNFRE